MQNKISLARDRLKTYNFIINLPIKAYILCSCPRSGTYMFGGIMRDMRLGDPFESFNFGANRRYRPYYDVSDYKTLITRIIEQQTSPDTGVFGVKVFYDHLHRFYNKAKEIQELSDIDLTIADMLEVFFGKPQYLFLRRRNFVKQSVSLAKAIQTDHYQTIDELSDTRKAKKTKYDANLITQQLLRILSENLLWEDFFAKHDIVPYRFWFEDILNEREKSISGVLSFLDEKQELKIPAPRTKKISTNTDSEWNQRYLEENGWLQIFDLEELISSQEYVNVLSRLSFNQSILQSYQKKSIVEILVKRGINSIRWRLGKGNIGY